MHQRSAATTHTSLSRMQPLMMMPLQPFWCAMAAMLSPSSAHLRGVEGCRSSECELKWKAWQACASPWHVLQTEHAGIPVQDCIACSRSSSRGTAGSSSSLKKPHQHTPHAGAAVHHQHTSLARLLQRRTNKGVGLHTEAEGGGSGHGK